MINELLEKRELLNDIATELYGELWVTVDEFWGSPTEKEMAEVQDQLLNLGWTPDEPNDVERAIADIIAEELLKKGKKF